MDLFEYQAKELFLKHGVPGTQGRVTDTAEGARAIAEEVGKPVMVKAQVKVGGRGKAGGVKLAATPEEAHKNAEQILGMQIKGLTVKKVLVAEAIDIKNEIYMSVTVDRVSKRPFVMVSAAGGVDIEQIAAETPEKIHKFAVDPIAGLRMFEARRLTTHLFDDPKAVGAEIKAFQRCKDPGGKPAGSADQDQRLYRNSAVDQLAIGLQQRRDILSRLEGPHKEQIARVKAVSGQRGPGFGEWTKMLVRCQVNGRHLVGRCVE